MQDIFEDIEKVIFVFIGELLNFLHFFNDVWCAYETVDNTTTNGANTMIDAIAATFGGVPGGAGEAGKIYDGISEAIGGANGMLGGYQGNDEPAAYMNYILFDKDYNFEQGGIWYTIDGNNNEGVNMQQFTFGEDITVKEPGYLFVYLSNESVDDGHKVYFDELNISITKPVIQVEEYYPFGLSIAELSTTRENIIDQKFKYNGFEYQEDFGTNLYDYQARYYDPALGRFINVDPAAALMRRFSPYSYSFDNPIRYTDPDGMLPFDETFDNFNNDNFDPPIWEPPVDNQSGFCKMCDEKSNSFDFNRDPVLAGNKGDDNGGDEDDEDKDKDGDNKKDKSEKANVTVLPIPIGFTSSPVIIPEWLVSTGSFISQRVLPFVALLTLSGDTRQKDLTLMYTPPPKTLPGFPGAEKVPRKGRARWRTQDGDILEWDSQHGDVEVYNKKGKHKGSADPDTGEMNKDPVPGRKIDP